MYGGTSGQGWLGLAVFLVICGLVIGLALIGSDLINPISSWAESERYHAETQRIIEQDSVDLEQYKKQREAETQAEIQRLNGDLAQQARLYEVEIQRLNEEMLQKQQMHEEETRQAREMAALKLSLLNTAEIIIAVSIGISLIILSLGVIRRPRRNPPHPPRLVQANLRPQQPLFQTWQTASHQHKVHTGNGGKSHKSLQTP
jgi:TolA-binding protein